MGEGGREREAEIQGDVVGHRSRHRTGLEDWQEIQWLMEWFPKVDCCSGCYQRCVDPGTKSETEKWQF